MTRPNFIGPWRLQEVWFTDATTDTTQRRWMRWYILDPDPDSCDCCRWTDERVLCGPVISETTEPSPPITFGMAP